MADRSITVKIGANVQGLVSGLKTAAQATQDASRRTGEWVTKHRDGINEISGGLVKAGAVVTAFSVLAVKKFADFDKAMSSVAAATMESAENMALLRQAAIEAGADTQYSASEAAGAIESLAKAGVTTADILGGGLDGALSLAAAGQMDVAEAADIAATAMTQFGKGGRDVTHISDLLAAGAGKAQGDVSDLSMALKQSGLVASQMGLSLEETTGTLTAFASAGLLGSDAGTSFRTMLLRLSNPSQESAEQMKELGISAYDAQGNFVGMTSLAGQLDRALKPLPQSQRDAAMATIFGSDAIRAANVLYTQGEAGIRQWITAVDDQGYAAEQARIKTDNLAGDIERLSGSLDSAFIKSGSGANAVLRDMAQGAEAVVDKIGGLPEPLLATTTLLVGAGGLTTLGVGGMLKLVTGINDAKVAVEGLGQAGKVAKVAVGGVGAAIAIGTLAFAAWAQSAAEAEARVEGFMDTLDEYGNRTTRTMAKINDALSKDNRSWSQKLFGADQQSLIDQAKEYGLAAEDMQGYILGQADAVERVNAAMDAYIGLSKTGMEQRGAEEQVNQFTGALDKQADSLTEAEKQAAQKAEADRVAGVAASEAAAATNETTSALKTYAQAQQSGTSTTETYTDALKEMVDQQREAAGVVLDLRDAQRNLEQSIADASQALADNGATLDITTEKGRANQAAIDDVASAGWDLIDSMRANGATQGELQATMQSTRDRFLGVAEAMGMSRDDAALLADQLGLIPQNVSVAVAVDTAAAEEQINQFFRLQNGRTIRMNVATGEFTVAGSGVRGNAEGGYQVGPGTGTSDSIPSWLSNGEYVIKASSVRKYGRAMFDGLNAGRYAGGGLVQPARQYVAPAPFAMAQPIAPAAASPGPVSFFEGSTIVAADPHAAASEMSNRMRLEMVGMGGFQ